MKRALIVAAFGLLLAGCPPEPQIPEPVIPEVSGSEWCERAEKNLLALGCQEGQPTKRGKRFADFCRETQDNGINLNPQCLAGVKACEEIDKVCAWNE